MKNKIACLAIASVMVAGLCAAGCGGNDGGNVTEIENADILALSYDRLENADLSFDFSIDKSVQTTEYSLKGEKAALYASDGEDKSVILTPDDIVEPRYTYDFFKSNKENLEGISRTSREIADFAIERVTVVNKFADFGPNKYLLDYDRESDTVTVIKYMEWNGAISEYYKISIYYDADGDETVEYWFYSPAGNTSHAVYCADKTYYFVFNQFGKNQTTGEAYATYNLSNAYKENGKWRGLKTYFTAKNPIFTHEGVYNFANGIINLEFMVEEDGEIYNLTDRFIPYRNGQWLGSGVEALPTDEFRFEQYYMNTPVVSVNCEANLLYIDMAAVDGWSQVKAFEETNKLVLGNGGLAPDNSVLVEGLGWLLSDGKGNYYTEGGELVPDDQIRTAKHVEFRINTGEPYGSTGKIQNAFLEFPIENVIENGFDLVDFFFNYCGLSFNGEASRTMLMDMKDIQSHKNEYLDGIYQRLCGGEYTVENAVEYMRSIMTELDGFEEEIVAFVPQYEVVSEFDMPEKPADLGLAEFGKNVAGKVVISSDGLDFSGVTLSVKKSALLSAGKTYGVTVGFSSGAGSVLVDAYDGAVYNKADLTFTGKSGVALPLAREGEYTLVAFFGRADGENAMIRLSEICTLTAENFADFEITNETEDGVWTYAYKCVNGTVKLTVTFAAAEQQ